MTVGRRPGIQRSEAASEHATLNQLTKLLRLWVARDAYLCLARMSLLWWLSASVAFAPFFFFDPVSKHLKRLYAG